MKMTTTAYTFIKSRLHDWIVSVYLFIAVLVKKIRMRCSWERSKFTIQVKSVKNGIVAYTVDGKTYRFPGKERDLRSLYTPGVLRDALQGFGALPIMIRSVYLINHDLGVYCDFTAYFEQLMGPRRDFHCGVARDMEALVSFMFAKVPSRCDSFHLIISLCGNRKIEHYVNRTLKTDRRCGTLKSIEQLTDDLISTIDNEEEF